MDSPPTPDINVLPPEVLALVLKRLTLRQVIPLHTTSKLWDLVIHQLEATSRLLQEKFFFLNNEFIQIGQLATDTTEHNWAKILESRTTLPRMNRFFKIPDPKAIEAQQLKEDEMGTPFPSLCPNVAIYSGCYYYEVKLHKAGLLQIGWTSLDRLGNGLEGEGIGDTASSWAYDGDRQMLWNAKFMVLSKPFPHEWEDGDIIGCGIDADKGQIDFWKNGIHLGTAWENIFQDNPVHPPFFPGISFTLSPDPVTGVSVSFTVNLDGPYLALPEGYNGLTEGIPSHFPVELFSVGPGAVIEQKQKTADTIASYKNLSPFTELLTRVPEIDGFLNYKPRLIIEDESIPLAEKEHVINLAIADLGIPVEPTATLQEKKDIVIEAKYMLLDQSTREFYLGFFPEFWKLFPSGAKPRKMYHLSHLVKIQMLVAERMRVPDEDPEPILGHPIFRCVFDGFAQSLQPRAWGIVKELIDSGPESDLVFADAAFVPVLAQLEANFKNNDPISRFDEIVIAHYFFCLKVEEPFPWQNTTEELRKIVAEDAPRLRKVAFDYFEKVFDEHLAGPVADLILQQDWNPMVMALLKQHLLPILAFDWVHIFGESNDFDFLVGGKMLSGESEKQLDELLQSIVLWLGVETGRFIKVASTDDDQPPTDTQQTSAQVPALASDLSANTLLEPKSESNVSEPPSEANPAQQQAIHQPKEILAFNLKFVLSAIVGALVILVLFSP